MIARNSTLLVIAGAVFLLVEGAACFGVGIIVGLNVGRARGREPVPQKFAGGDMGAAGKKAASEFKRAFDSEMDAQAAKAREDDEERAARREAFAAIPPKLRRMPRPARLSSREGIVSKVRGDYGCWELAVAGQKEPYCLATVPSGGWDDDLDVVQQIYRARGKRVVLSIWPMQFRAKDRIVLVVTGVTEK